MDQHIEELLQQARSAARVDRERIELFEMLIKHPGWEVYVELINAKLQMLADEVLAPANGVDRMVGLEYVKGTMSGLVMARDITTATIAGKEQLIEPVIGDEVAEEESENG